MALGLPMTDEEICRDYRQAKDQREQIRILAELNLCKPKEIAEILVAGGCTVDKRFLLAGPAPKKPSGRPENVRAAAIDVIAALLDGTPRTEAGCLAFREQVVGVLRMVYEMEGGEADES